MGERIMKILQIGMGNVAGGLEAFVMNYYRVLVHMDIQFDFVCMYDKIAYEEEIRKLGGRIYYIPNVKKNYQGYIKELKKILKETKYDAVHVNMLSAANIVPLRVAHTMKVPKIIAHSHSSSCPGLIRKIMDNWNRPKIAKYATDRIACGEMAGRWLFGDKAFQSGQVTLINNAIQAEKFSFSEKDRDSLRKELGWENKTLAASTAMTMVNLPSRMVWEMSSTLTFISASLMHTAAMIPTLSFPITVTIAFIPISIPPLDAAYLMISKQSKGHGEPIPASPCSAISLRFRQRIWRGWPELPGPRPPRPAGRRPGSQRC